MIVTPRRLPPERFSAEVRERPSGHVIRGTFAEDRGGAIPSNVIQCGNNESGSNFLRKTKERGYKIHPARFPQELPRFFVEFLTHKGDLVLDPFAGSNTTGYVAEALGRQWLAVEKDPAYALGSRLRFDSLDEPAPPAPATDAPALEAAPADTAPEL